MWPCGSCEPLRSHNGCSFRTIAPFGGLFYKECTGAGGASGYNSANKWRQTKPSTQTNRLMRPFWETPFFIHMCGRFDTFIHTVRFTVQCATLKGKKQRWLAAFMWPRLGRSLSRLFLWSFQRDRSDDWQSFPTVQRNARQLHLALGAEFRRPPQKTHSFGMVMNHNFPFLRQCMHRSAWKVCKIVQMKRKTVQLVCEKIAGGERKKKSLHNNCACFGVCFCVPKTTQRVCFKGGVPLRLLLWETTLNNNAGN